MWKIIHPVFSIQTHILLNMGLLPYDTTRPVANLINYLRS